MKLVDLNLLVYAVNESAIQHAEAHRWWEETMNGDEQVGLAWLGLMGFVRLTTRRGVLPSPLPVRRALDLVETWVTHPLTVLAHPGDRHWSIYRGLIEKAGSAGNLTTDAHLAALAMEYDATLYSSDGDYRRFAGLKIRNPLIASGARS